MQPGAIQLMKDRFDALSQHTPEENVEFWFARDLMEPLGYARWENFQTTVRRAIESCETTGYAVGDHFRGVTKMVGLGSGSMREIDDFMLTRYACYLIAQNGDLTLNAASLDSRGGVLSSLNGLLQSRLNGVLRNGQGGKIDQVVTITVTGTNDEALISGTSDADLTEGDTVGAIGVMQVMPATGKWVANKIGLAGYHPGLLNDPDTNVLLGTSYMRIIMEDLDAHPVLASAGYNAGPGRARRWRDVQPLEGAIYAETIPFDETRDYVKKVLANAVIYSAMLEKRPQSLKARLGTIAPAPASE